MCRLTTLFADAESFGLSFLCLNVMEGLNSVKNGGSPTQRAKQSTARALLMLQRAASGLQFIKTGKAGDTFDPEKDLEALGLVMNIAKSSQRLFPIGSTWEKFLEDIAGALAEVPHDDVTLACDFFSALYDRLVAETAT